MIPKGNSKVINESVEPTQSEGSSHSNHVGNYFSSSPFGKYQQHGQQNSVEQNIHSEHQSRRSQHAASFIQNEVQCDLCITDYDLYENVPMMLCDNQHNCCLQCVKEIVLRKKECPFCREAINPKQIKKNRIVAQMVLSEAKRKGITLKVNSNPQKEILKQFQGERYPASNNEAQNIRRSIVIQDEFPQMSEQDESFLQSLLNQNYQNNVEAERNSEEGEYIRIEGESSSCSCAQILCCCCIRVELDSTVYPVAIFFSMFYNVPFFVVELYYAFSLPEQNCLDVDYGMGVTLRDWLFLSGKVGAGLFLSLILFVFVWKAICYTRCGTVSKTVSVLNIIAFVLKFLGMNIWGFVVSGYIDDDDAQSCDSGLSSYMEALLIIEIVIIVVLGYAGEKGRN